MTTSITRQEALALLKKYNKEPFHLLHAFTVEGVMRWYAQEMGYGEETEYWALAGLLHDVDFEVYPEEHCKKAPELLAEIHAGEDLTHSVCSHGYGICSDIEPTHPMEKVLFATDELTGLIGAAVRMRPSKSVMDLEVSSLKKKTQTVFNRVEKIHLPLLAARPVCRIAAYFLYTGLRINKNPASRILRLREGLSYMVKNPSGLPPGYASFPLPPFISPPF